MDDQPTKVIFRVFKPRPEFQEAGGDVLALFPDIPEDRNGWYCSSYQHIGQHGAADYQGCIKCTRPAKPDEYAPLKRELEQIGYKLLVRKRR